MLNKCHVLNCIDIMGLCIFIFIDNKTESQTSAKNKPIRINLVQVGHIQQSADTPKSPVEQMHISFL